ncbi:hypothetical protein TSTA_118170 [Talaromyces stipitatus ATCC 10500]|uniref:MobA-like NTP transferase domain-containing protein n=1 Tax=Talaromyces stipitatus (strain ATCC 10500 / CBS 375.48 / QM 6759 / NRRL 1006) TaxID=441959 RepID=B8M9P5_TALSN|nr:uncharacterized protein TSTA_118170 [Talaromyces stipitatus ATCC 10500]EED18047.1 hypothetical protein TSTA_118170 [Talaromyces stipitatus ATCC 10500]
MEKGKSNVMRQSRYYHPAVDVSTPANCSLRFHGNFTGPIFFSIGESLTEYELSQEKQSFRYFITKASIQIPSVLDLRIWTEAIPLLSTAFPAIRYTLLALSAQHEVTIRSSHGNNNETLVHALRLYSYRQYGKAIQRLNFILIDAVQKHDIFLETSFACLLLVVCEVLRGVDVAAQYHLDGAINLISIPSVAKSQLVLAENRCATFPDSSELLRALGLIFQQLDLQAAAFAGSRLPIGPDNVDSITEYSTLRSPGNNFNGGSTIEELRQSLLSTQVEISRFVASETVIRWKYSAESKRGKDQKNEFRAVKKERDILIQQLQQWKIDFDTISLELSNIIIDYGTNRNMLPERQLDYHQQCARIVMLLSYFTYYILLSTSLSYDETTYDSYTLIFAHIIDLSETVLQLEQPSFFSDGGSEAFSSSAFCIDMKLIYPLYITALKCREFIIRHRAVCLLSMCGREGVWDGRMMASMAQSVISYEEEYAIIFHEYGQKTPVPMADSVKDCIISIPEKARIHGVGIVDMDRTKRQLRIACYNKNETTTTDNEVIWERILLDLTFSLFLRENEHRNDSTSLILAGGQSSRMGSRKELLNHPSGLQMYQYLINTISQACPQLDTIYMSVKNENLVPPWELHRTQSTGNKVSIRFIYDDSDHDKTTHTAKDIGPAAGLLVAYHTNPKTNWLIVACDFPLLQIRTLQRLIESSTSSPVTCYRNSKGFCEPFLAIWSPEGLEKLAENVRQGRTGPRFVIEELADAQIISPENEMELFNVNTVKELQEACHLLKDIK